jgi:hypothetical protein
MCLLYEMYKVNIYPSPRVVYCTLQLKLHVVLGVHSKAAGRHRPTITSTVLEADFFLEPLIVHVRGGASMYLKKQKNYFTMASFGAWDFCRQ